MVMSCVTSLLGRRVSASAEADMRGARSQRIWGTPQQMHALRKDFRLTRKDARCLYTEFAPSSMPTMMGRKTKDALNSTHDILNMY